jgi:hypothetical protein
LLVFVVVVPPVGADCFFGSLLFDYDAVEWLRSQLAGVPVVLVFESALELMGQTRIGSFTMDPSGVRCCLAGDKVQHLPLLLCLHVACVACTWAAVIQLCWRSRSSCATHSYAQLPLFWLDLCCRQAKGSHFRQLRCTLMHL